jgi:hypothetical protein
VAGGDVTEGFLNLLLVVPLTVEPDPVLFSTTTRMGVRLLPRQQPAFSLHAINLLRVSHAYVAVPKFQRLGDVKSDFLIETFS